MNQKTLQAAIIEAERFLDLAKDLHMQSAHIKVDCIYIRALEQGRLRCASADLTRALADLRRAS